MEAQTGGFQQGRDSVGPRISLEPFGVIGSRRGTCGRRSGARRAVAAFSISNRVGAQLWRSRAERLWSRKAIGVR